MSLSSISPLINWSSNNATLCPDEPNERHLAVADHRLTEQCPDRNNLYLLHPYISCMCHSHVLVIKPRRPHTRGVVCHAENQRRGGEVNAELRSWKNQRQVPRFTSRKRGRGQYVEEHRRVVTHRRTEREEREGAV